MAKLLKRLQDTILAGVLKLFAYTLRFAVENQPLPEDEPVIYAFWHRNLIYAALQRSGDPIVVMISPSKDGELLSGPVEKLGYLTVRGSSSRGGAAALKAMLRYAKTHSLGITPDGPKGPVGTIHAGLWQLAILGNIPIHGVYFEVSREWTFKSWDRFRFPKPFARVHIRYSQPIWLNSKEDIPAAEAELRGFLDKPGG
ncbi:MAG: lysophospholipid acyltransferase family protein [Candidatus Cloacimonadaceae bacterium]